MTTLQPTPGYRMNVLIRCRANVCGDELVAHGFATASELELERRSSARPRNILR